MITDRKKAPDYLHYNVSNNSGSINKDFGKNQTEAYTFAYNMKETAIIRGFYYYMHPRLGYVRKTIFLDHIWK